MKRILPVMLSILLFLLLCLCILFFWQEKKENKKIRSVISMRSETNLEQIDEAEFRRLLKKKGKMMVLIGRDSCAECAALKPILKQQLLLASVHQIYWYNTKTYIDQMGQYSEDSSEYKKLFSDYMKIKEEFSFQSVPTLQVYENGKLKKIMNDYLDDDYVNMPEKEQKDEEKKGLKNLQNMIRYYDTLNDKEIK